MKMRKFRPAPSSIWRDSSGTGALELALALPILLVLFAGMIDLSRVIAGRIDMEQAAIRATDYALAVRPAGRAEAISRIRNEAAAAGDVPSGDVSVDIFLECNGVRQGNFNSVCTSSQDQARFVSVAVSQDVNAIFDWASLAEILGWNIGTPPNITVTGDSVVRFQ